MPPPMLRTLSFFASDAVIAMRDVQRTTEASNGNAKPSVTMCDALPIPPPPPSQRSKGEATNRDAIELVVRRTIFSSDLSRISRHQISVRVFVQHLLVSTNQALVTSWRAFRKNDLENSSVAERPEHRQEHLLFDNTKKTTNLDVQGWTHQHCLAPESCSHIAILSRTEEFVGVDHKPYKRCNTWALMPFQTVGLGSELNVSSLQRIVSSLLLRRKLRVMRGKISKNVCHPSINASHHTTEPLFSINATSPNSVEDLFTSSAVVAPATTVEEHVSVHDPTHGDTGDAKDKKSRQRRLNVQSAFQGSCSEVRFHVDVKMSIKMCVYCS